MNALQLGITTDEYGNAAGLYLPDAERGAHVYVIGSTGVGKSRAIASWALDDLMAGHGFGVIDPHGDLITDILTHAVAFPEIHLIDFGSDETVALNPLEPLPGVDVYAQTLELVDVFRKIWDLSDASAPRLLEILRNAIFTLIEAGGTLLDIERLLTNKAYRASAIDALTHEPIAHFWRDRFDRWPERERTLYIESTLNKASAFASDPRLRRMLGATHGSIDFREIMDRRRVLLVDVSKGVLRTNTNLVGALVLSRIQMTAVGRLTVPAEYRTPWTLYVDEFQNYATDSFAEILAEARKMGLRLVLANQTLAQLPDQLRSIILANARNLIAFRIDRLDAELLVRYLGSIDPRAVKSRDLDRVYFATPEEQWERQIAELTSLPLRTAVLRTKGRAPRRFRSVRLDSNARISDEHREIVREFGRELGWLQGRLELEEKVASSDYIGEAEPADYWESPRGSD